MDKYLNIKQVADWLNLSPKTIYGWVYKRKIPHVRVNGEIRFVERHINGWLEQRTVQVKTA